MDTSVEESCATLTVGIRIQSKHWRYFVCKGNWFGINQVTFAETRLSANAVSQHWTRNGSSLSLAILTGSFPAALVAHHVPPLEETHKLLLRHVQHRSKSPPRPAKHDLQETTERLAVIPATKEKPEGSLESADVYKGAERKGNFSTSAEDLLRSKQATTAPREPEAEQQGDVRRPWDPHHRSLISDIGTDVGKWSPALPKPVLALVSPCIHSVALAHGRYCSACLPPHTPHLRCLQGFSAPGPWCLLYPWARRWRPRPGPRPAPHTAASPGGSRPGRSPSALPCLEPAHAIQAPPHVTGTLGMIWAKNAYFSWAAAISHAGCCMLLP